MANVERRLRGLDRNERVLALIIRYWWVQSLLCLGLVLIGLWGHRWGGVVVGAALGVGWTFWLRSGRYQRWAEGRIARRRARLEDDPD